MPSNLVLDTKEFRNYYFLAIIQKVLFIINSYLLMLILGKIGVNYCKHLPHSETWLSNGSSYRETAEIL